MDGATEGRPLFQSPFRHEVSASDFFKIEQTRKEIDDVSFILDKPKEKAQLAQVIEGKILDPQTPNEAKPEAFQRVFNLIQDPAERDINLSIARTLIDTIRAETNPHLKLRYAGMITHALESRFNQPFVDDIGKNTELVRPQEQKPKMSLDDYIARQEKVATFEKLAETAGIDENLTQDPMYRKWADALLSPKGAFKMYGRLHGGNNDLRITPHVLEEITEEFEDNEGEGIDPSIAGALVRLGRNYLPTFDKMAEFEGKTGKPLPFFIVWREGKKFHNIEFPPDLTEHASDLLIRFRAGEISRKEVFEKAQDLEDDFLSRMNPEQRADIEEKIKSGRNITIKFATHRGEPIKATEPIPREPILAA